MIKSYNQQWIAQGELLRRLKGASFPEYALAAVAPAEVLTSDSLGQDCTLSVCFGKWVPIKLSFLAHHCKLAQCWRAQAS